MKMVTMKLSDLLALITFPFGECSVVNNFNVLQAITDADPNQEEHHYNPNNYTIYTIDAWIAECKRCKEIDDLQAQSKMKQTFSLSDLEADLVVAISVGDMVRAMEIQQQLKERRQHV